jgi:hypothetical protein
MAFHWHGDTFDIPPGAFRTAESAGCSNQAFEYKGRVIGLQFHLESSDESIRKLIQNCGDEIVDGRYIQKSGEMLGRQVNLLEINQMMDLLLDHLEEKFGSGF